MVLIEKPDKNVIEQFFEGKSYFENTDGHYWVANHGGKVINIDSFDGLEPDKKPDIHSKVNGNSKAVIIDDFQTLTFEPKSGGQYEIAIRIWSEGEWKGYYVNDSFFKGVNVRGH